MFDFYEKQLTPRTTVYIITLNGKFFAQSGQWHAANNICAYLNENNITTIEKWREVPFKVRRQFISSTNCTVDAASFSTATKGA